MLCLWFDISLACGDYGCMCACLNVPQVDTDTELSFRPRKSHRVDQVRGV